LYLCPPLITGTSFGAALNEMLRAEERQIMTEVQNFSHYAKNEFPFLKVLIAVERWNPD